MLLSIAVPWLFTILLLNLGAVTPVSFSGGISVPGQWDQGERSLFALGGIGLGGGVAQGSRLLVATFAAFALLLVLVVWHSRHSNFQSKSVNPLFYLLSLGFTITLVYGTIVFASTELPSLVIQPFVLPDLIPYFAFGALMICVVVGFSFMLGQRGVSASQQRTKVTTGEEAASEVAAILDNTARSLGLGLDYREAILGCYRDICKVFEGEVTVDNSRLTAREFESLAARRLNMGRDYLHEATILFERAKYSDDHISSEDSERARACLEQLSKLVASSPRSARTEVGLE